MISPKKYFILYACCIPVKGVVRSIICDIQRSTFEYIPMGLYEVLTVTRKMPLDDIYKKYSHLDKEILDEYFVWLEEKEFGFMTTSPENFPQLKLRYNTPEVINNAIIDIDENSKHDYIELFYQLDYLGCKFIEIRSYCKQDFLAISNILKHTNNLRFRNIDFILKYDSSANLNSSEIEIVFTEYPLLGKLIYHSAPQTETSSPLPGRFLVLLPTIVESEMCCGKISLDSFAINIETFVESQKWNTCLNKKVSIDRYGYIKNCPSMNKSFGHISVNKIIDVIEIEDFKKIWAIGKNKINVCKVCEFRHICTDCRAFLPIEKQLDKPFKCKYNPYTATWEK
jgi:SPASM domain peptide maturase of grasp-with-spasm system